MVELVDSVDLGSSVLDVQVRVLLPAPNKKGTQGVPFLFGMECGLEPTQMQMSGGHLLPKKLWKIPYARLTA